METPIRVALFGFIIGALMAFVSVGHETGPLVRAGDVGVGMAVVGLAVVVTNLLARPKRTPKK